MNLNDEPELYINRMKLKINMLKQSR